LLVKKEAQNVVSLVESEKEALTIVYSKVPYLIEEI
jgi:helix-turn-helix protein